MTFNAMNLRWHGTGLGLLLGCLGFIAFLRCEAQTNLVPNWSFEIPEDSCSWQCCFNVGSRPLHWFSWMNSPDHFSACAGGSGGDDSLMTVPQNGWSYQLPWDGEAYVGVYAYDGYPAEYRSTWVLSCSSRLFLAVPTTCVSGPIQPMGGTTGFSMEAFVTT
jgi:hypothetical protein